MSKKLWIRLVGLLALFAWGIAAVLFWTSTVAPDVTTKSNVSVLTFMMSAGAGLLTFIWTALSLVDRLDHPARNHNVAARQ
jgi:hypothetical protein